MQSILTIDMRKIIYALVLMLLLSACGRGEESIRVAELEAENAAIEAENAALKKENASLRTKIDELSNSSNTNSTEENPIDGFFEAFDEYDGSTVSMNIVANSWADAWEAETRHLAEELKAQLSLQEDWDLVDEYISAAEGQIGRMDVMAIYPVSDTGVPYPDRLYSSGTLRGVLWAGSRQEIWRDTYFQLLYVLPERSACPYIFDSDAARISLTEELSY